MKAWEIVKRVEEGITEEVVSVTVGVKSGENLPVDYLKWEQRKGLHSLIAGDYEVIHGGGRTKMGLNSLIAHIWYLFGGTCEPNTKADPTEPNQST